MRTFLVSLILTAACLTSSAQSEKLFNAYRSYGELYGIDVKKPEGFHIIDYFALIKLNKNYDIGMGYEVIFQSECKDCLFLFPMYDTLKGRNLYANMTYGEVEAALRIDPKKETMDTARYVKIVAETNMSDCFNADTVSFYKVPLDSIYVFEPFPLSPSELRAYTTCIGINMRKSGFPSMLAKILLTEEGKKKEKEYVETFLSCIRYGDKPKKYSRRKERRVINRYYRKLGL